ncbi:MAG: hypothetical protein VX257_09065 [Planctomycetota bacterium]|nr:hypothetical protein [Planctomycetota bacterium]
MRLAHWLIGASLILGLLVAFADGAEKKNQKKKGSNASKKAAQRVFAEFDRQIKGARAHAASVGGYLEQVKSQAASVGAEMYKAQKQLEEATRNLAALKEGIAESAPSKSAYAEARAKYDSARAEQQSETDRLLGAADVQVAVRAAADGSEAAEIKNRVLDSSSVMAGLRGLVRETRLASEAELRKLLQDDVSWSRAQASVLTSRSAYQFHKEQLTKIGGQRIEAVDKFNIAKGAVVALEKGKIQAQIAHKRAEAAKKSKKKKKKKKKK